MGREGKVAVAVAAGANGGGPGLEVGPGSTEEPVAGAPPVSSAQTSGVLWGRLAVGLVTIVGVYLPIMPEIVHEWATFPSLSHGFAVPFIAAYLVWIRRLEIEQTPECPSWWGLPLTAFGLALYVAGGLGGEPFLARVTLPLTLLGAVILVCGRAVARPMAAGIAYLIFMIPLPWVTVADLTDRMRLFDATVTAGILPWVGVPVFQEGYLLHLPNMTLEVADVCSSIPAIASFLALAAAYGYVNRRPPLALAILVLAAVPFGVISNIIRILTTAAGVYYIGPIAIHNVVHTWNGLTVFLLTLVLLMALDAVLRRLWRKAA